jgi:ParB-like chromosome segregation protein Spo0J
MQKTESQVERWPLARLRAYERNPRAHSDRQIEQLAASISQFGWTVPVLVDDTGMILAGAGRVLAARQLGLQDVPVIVARGWSEEQKKGYLIADNRLSELSRWDDDLLALELNDLAVTGFDLDLLGISEADMKRLAGERGELAVREIAVGNVRDNFWISIRGPLKHQADALLKLETAMKGFDDVTVELGTTEVEEERSLF